MLSAQISCGRKPCPECHTHRRGHCFLRKPRFLIADPGHILHFRSPARIFVRNTPICPSHHLRAGNFDYPRRFHRYRFRHRFRHRTRKCPTALAPFAGSFLGNRSPRRDYDRFGYLFNASDHFDLFRVILRRVCGLDGRSRVCVDRWVDLRRTRHPNA
jgi:hypothetical protein